MKRLIDGPGAVSEPVRLSGQSQSNMPNDLAVLRTQGLVVTPKGRDAFERTLWVPREALTA